MQIACYAVCGVAHATMLLRRRKRRRNLDSSNAVDTKWQHFGPFTLLSCFVGVFGALATAARIVGFDSMYRTKQLDRLNITSLKTQNPYFRTTFGIAPQEYARAAAAAARRQHIDTLEVMGRHAGSEAELIHRIVTAACCHCPALRAPRRPPSNIASWHCALQQASFRPRGKDNL